MAEVSPSPRVVSLIASATEIVAALGFEDCLVGRSHECDFPPSVRRLPACTAPRFRTEGSSAQVHRRVEDALRDALSVYRVDADLLAGLAPDVIVTQSQCAVCAVSLADVERALSDWVESRPRVVSLEPCRLADVVGDIRKVAAALGAREAGERLAGEIAARMAEIADEAGALPDKPAVACIEWIDPLMAAGNWMPELVAMAGGRNLFGEAGKHSPWMAFEELVAAEPDVIVVLPCGYDLEKTRSEMGALAAARPEWQHLRAVRAGCVYVTDGNQYFNRPGPRLADSLEILAEVFHPGAFRYGHEGTGWERL
jgi:iron complex transport system substrate-binding protein